jgi:hypothetical protein
MRTNAEQILRENYDTSSKELSFKEWVKNEAVSDPSFFYWFFPHADNITGDYGQGLTDSQEKEFCNFINTL